MSKITPEDDPHLRFLPLDKVDTAHGHCDARRDHWWIVHPTKGLMFWQQNLRSERLGYGWGNSSKTITERIRDMHFPWASVQQFPLVLVPIHARDFE